MLDQLKKMTIGELILAKGIYEYAIEIWELYFGSPGKAKRRTLILYKEVKKIDKLIKKKNKKEKK